jgi:phosphate-selective porin OprO/OprP
MHENRRTKALRHCVNAGAISFAALLSGTSAAADKELLDILLKNGVINNQQYGALSQKGGEVSGGDLLEILQKNGAITKDQYATLSKKQSAPATAAAAPAKVEEKEAAHVKLGERGLEIESNDGNFKAKIGGRIQVDSQVNFNDNGPPGTDLDNGVGFRRLRLYTEGVMFKDYEYRFEYDWARNGGGVNGITDAYLKYIRFKPFAITIGQMSEGKSMESVMSNNYLTFVERSLPNNAFIEAGPNSKYQMGIMAETFDKAFEMPWTLRGGLTTESVGAPAPGNSSNNTAAGNTNRNAFSGNTSYQLVGRGTLAPIYNKDDGTLLHTGVWGSWRSVNNNYNPDGTLRNGGWQYLSQPDSPIDRTNWVNTGNLTKGNRGAPGSFEAKEVAMFGAELAGAYGPVHLESEYMQAQISGHNYSSSDILTGWYVQGGWFLTGENRPYDDKKGTRNRLIPKSNFLFGDGWGAWEVAARYDTVDLSTKHINGGSINAFTLGVNWYLTPRVRLLTDWVHVLNTSTAVAGKCTYTGTGNDPISCFNGLSPDIWETAVRLDF